VRDLGSKLPRPRSSSFQRDEAGQPGMSGFVESLVNTVARQRLLEEHPSEDACVIMGSSVQAQGRAGRARRGAARRVT